MLIGVNFGSLYYTFPISPGFIPKSKAMQGNSVSKILRAYYRHNACPLLKRTPLQCVYVGYKPKESSRALGLFTILYIVLLFLQRIP